MLLLPIEIPSLKIGIKSTIQKRITGKDTAKYYGSGALDNLLPIPVLTAVMIEAAVALVDPMLPEGIITAGKYTQVDHQHPTVEGMTLTVTAELIEIHGNVLRFAMNAYDEIGQVATGIHDRVIINKDGFFRTVENRVNPLKTLVD